MALAEVLVLTQQAASQAALPPIRIGLEAQCAPEEPPLVEAKITPPQLRDTVVSRPRLMKGLDAGARTAVTLVSAPVGHGKSTLVRAWCESQTSALAWVNLDALDNDPVRLWTYITAAIDRIRPGLAERALQRMAHGSAAVEPTIDEVMNAIGGYGKPVTLVLDDLHVLTERQAVESIDQAMKHAPHNLRLILSTRRDPALAIPRLRAAQELTELRAADLCFTTLEARALLVERAGLELSDELLESLVERTQGWPAALVLAGLWLRTVDDLGDAVSRFGGDQHFVADYLSTEVLASLDDERRRFLQALAVLGECSPELCDAVLGSSDSANNLVELEHANLFVSRLERGELFSIHPLFAEYARAQLEASTPGGAAQIHRRAASWLHSQGRPIEAMAHAAAAGDQHALADLLAEQHLSLIRGGNGWTLLHWVRTLGDEVLGAHPEVAVAAAITTIMLNAGAMERRRYLGLAHPARAAIPGPTGAYVECSALICRGLAVEDSVGAAVSDSGRAVELAQGRQPELLDGALAAQARALYLAGDVRQAQAAGLDCLREPSVTSRPPTLIHVHSTLALVAVEQGRLHAARMHAEQARDLVGRVGCRRSWLGANAGMAMGTVLEREGRLAEAEREFTSAEHFLRDDVPTVHYAWLLLLMARVRVARGRLGRAAEAMSLAAEALAELSDAGVIGGLMTQVERELGLAEARACTGAVLEAPSEAELAVLGPLVANLSTREIGQRLFLSDNTVRSHRRALYRKLGVHSRAEAAARAAALGLLDEALTG